MKKNFTSHRDFQEKLNQEMISLEKTISSIPERWLFNLLQTNQHKLINQFYAN